MSNLKPAGDVPTDDLPRLMINLMREHDWLTCLEFGRVDDGQPSESWASLEGWHESIGLIHDMPFESPQARVVGFRIEGYSRYLEEVRDDDGSWGELWFHVPQLGLERAAVAEIAVETNTLFPEGSTPNRFFFNEAAALGNRGDAFDYWLSCLATGDSMAHFGVGCCLYEHGEYRDAYRHLRYYAQIAGNDPWNQRWYGAAAEAIGELDEALRAYETAVMLESLGVGPADGTDAADLRGNLLQKMAESGRGS